MKNMLAKLFRRASLKCMALAINHAPKTEIAIGTATNVSILSPSADEWRMIAPYGDTDYWAQADDGSWRKFIQSFQRPQADAMVTGINAQKVREGDSFVGLPIYRGHPDADPKQWPDDKRYGGVMQLEARADGLYGKIAWNTLGEENKRERYYVFPSPAWEYPQSDALVTGRIVPVSLRSIGLTNSPRIPKSRPWTNSDPGGSLFAGNNPVTPAGRATTKNSEIENEPMKTPKKSDGASDHRAMLLNLLNKHHDAKLGVETATNDDIDTA